jgi:hypothetical protein
MIIEGAENANQETLVGLVKSFLEGLQMLT